MSKRVIGLAILLMAAFVISVLSWKYTDSPRKADVALYAGRGTWEDSVRAIQSMFRWMNYTVELVSAEFINNNGLYGFRILCVPGGNMYYYAQDISLKGKENIGAFVRAGGGYIGICGGAYFAAEKVFWQGSQLPMAPLGLFAGAASGPIDEIMPYPNYTMCTVNIVDQAHPITKSEESPQTTLYYWGSALTPNTSANVTILGKYDKGNQITMLALEHYQGRAFLIGTHPEIEEDSSRDEVTFGDELDDEGSEWNMMQKAVLWLLQEN